MLLPHQCYYSSNMTNNLNLIANFWLMSTDETVKKIENGDLSTTLIVSFWQFFFKSSTHPTSFAYTRVLCQQFSSHGRAFATSLLCKPHKERNCISLIQFGRCRAFLFFFRCEQYTEKVFAIA